MGSLHRLPGIHPADAAVGARLRRWRERRGLSLEELARLMDLSPEEARLAETGRARLDSLGIGAAVRALRLPLWALQSDTPAH